MLALLSTFLLACSSLCWWHLRRCYERKQIFYGNRVFRGRTYTHEDEPFSYWVLMAALALCGLVFAGAGTFGLLTAAVLLR
jgi:hypothetical protein